MVTEEYGGSGRGRGMTRSGLILNLSFESYRRAEIARRMGRTVETVGGRRPDLPEAARPGKSSAIAARIPPGTSGSRVGPRTPAWSELKSCRKPPRVPPRTSLRMESSRAGFPRSGRLEFTRGSRPWAAPRVSSSIPSEGRRDRDIPGGFLLL